MGPRRVPPESMEEPISIGSRKFIFPFRGGQNDELFFLVVGRSAGWL